MKARAGILAAVVAVLGLFLWWDRGGPDGGIVRGQRPAERAATSMRGAGEAAPDLDEGTALGALPSGRIPTGDVGRVGGQEERLATLLLRVAWEEDGAPAAQVLAHVVSWGAPDPLADACDVETDREGVARMERLHPGRVTVYVDRGGQGSIVLEPGRAHELDVVIPTGTTVAGRVVDEEGEPVGGAGIWLSDYANPNRGRVVARGGADGRFELRGVGEARVIAARADGHAPSFGYDVVAGTEHVLVLPGAGGRLAGFVRGADGEPIAGAQVLLGHDRAPAMRLADGTRASAPAGQHTRTDEHGRYEVRGTPIGEVRLRARAGGYAPGALTVSIELGVATVADVLLEREAVVYGTVRNAAGEPEPEVFVGAGDYGSFESAQTRTAADGGFRLGGLGAGEVRVRANGRERGDAEATFVLAPGVEAEWDVVLEAGPSVGGRVVDHLENPLAGWLVGASAGGRGAYERSASTDEDGRFRLENCPDGDFVIEVREPDRWLGDPALVVSDFRLGDTELVLVVTEEARATAALAGRVVDRDGRAVPGAQVVVWSTVSGRGIPIEPGGGDGGFASGPLRPGRYDVTVEAPRFGRIHLDAIELAAGEARDLGPITLREPGALAVALDAPGGVVPAGALRCTLRTPGGRHVASVDLTGLAGRAESVAPGDYVLVTKGSLVATVETAVRVEPGEDVLVRVPLQRATRRTLELVAAADAAPFTKLFVEVRDASGRLEEEREYPVRSLSMRIFVTGLLPGVHSVEARTDTDLRASGSFEVESLEEVEEPIVLRLR